jgi:hypothetical protein
MHFKRPNILLYAFFNSPHVQVLPRALKILEPALDVSFAILK